jgi:dolichol-phosphate mannosyltransferase
VRPEVSVIVFAYDEAESVASMLSELSRFLEQAPFTSEIVFVDDGSTDATAEIARRVLPDAIHVRHLNNRGMGAALKSGVLACEGERITFLPADGQIPPETIAALHAASRDRDAAFSVYGSRRNDGVRRKLLSFAVRAMIAAAHGVRIRSDGPYMIRRELFDPAQLEADSFFLNFEVPIRAAAAKLRVAVVESDCRPRAHGHSKSANLRTIARVARDLIGLRLR